MRILSVWVLEFIKLLLGGRRLHPLNAECPICHRMVRLHYNKAGRRHLFAHARAYSCTLYEGSRYGAHYTAKVNVGVLACWRSSTRARMKVNNSSCQNPVSSKAKQAQYQSIAMNADFSLQ